MAPNRLSGADRGRRRLGQISNGELVGREQKYGTMEHRDGGRRIERLAQRPQENRRDRGSLEESVTRLVRVHRNRSTAERRRLRNAASIGLGEHLLCKGDDFIHTDVPILEVRNGRSLQAVMISTKSYPTAVRDSRISHILCPSTAPEGGGSSSAHTQGTPRAIAASRCG